MKKAAKPDRFLDRFRHSYEFCFRGGVHGAALAFAAPGYCAICQKEEVAGPGFSVVVVSGVIRVAVTSEGEVGTLAEVGESHSGSAGKIPKYPFDGCPVRVAGVTCELCNSANDKGDVRPSEDHCVHQAADNFSVRYGR